MCARLIWTLETSTWTLETSSLWKRTNSPKKRIMGSSSTQSDPAHVLDRLHRLRISEASLTPTRQQPWTRMTIILAGGNMTFIDRARSASGGHEVRCGDRRTAGRPRSMGPELQPGTALPGAIVLRPLPLLHQSRSCASADAVWLALPPQRAAPTPIPAPSTYRNEPAAAGTSGFVSPKEGQ
jgi:hypothetical protein